MNTKTSSNPETQFKRGAWLTLSIAIALLLYSIANLAYRSTLPTDGWVVSEGSKPFGFTYTKNLMGNPSPLQPGDWVIALDGIPAHYQTIQSSKMLQQTWHEGTTLEYTLTRDGKEINLPVTLVRWQIGKWLPAALLDPGSLAGLLSGIVLVALAAFVFFRRPGSPAAGAFLIIMVCLISPQLSETLPFGFSAWIDPVAKFMQNTVNWILLLALFPFALIRFALVFPRPKPIQQRHPWLSYAAGVFGLFLVIFFPDNPISWFWFVFSLFLSVAILIHNAFTMRDAASRAQMRWGLGGFIIGFGALAFMFLAGTSGLFELSPDFFSLVFVFAFTVMGSMLAVAILGYRLFDIDVIIRRTLVYGTLTLSLILVYFGAVVLFQNIFESFSGQQSPVAIVISTLLIAALFNPLRDRIQKAIDRRFYRRKYDAEKALADFSATLRDDMDVESLRIQVLALVEETLQPEQESLWLKEP